MNTISFSITFKEKSKSGSSQGTDWLPKQFSSIEGEENRKWKTTQPISDMANDNDSSYIEVGHLGSRSLFHRLRNFSGKLWWLITAARRARGRRADRTTAFASMNVPPLRQHSPLSSGAVSVQLLTCSYFETNGHCLESSAHPWQVLPWCLLLEETWGKRTAVELGLKNLTVIWGKKKKKKTCSI